uniref:Sptoxin beta-subunit n=1 Tax=Siganus puellus TaxID=406531 RepID=A0A348G6T0_9TELE|nr:sptoxin beta-subunit [Siganus puellus]
MASLMSVAALGRPFSLGMLYDARRDELVPGWRLWDEATLAGKKTQTVKPYSAFQISASDSIESRSNLLDVNASIKASFLSGLIEVGGSAKYLNDKKEFRHQSRVTCHYNATTTFEELSVVELDAMTKDQLDVIQKGVATHVVVGILYGANAVFVFDSQKVDSSSVQDIQGNMEAVIKKIPSFSIEGKAEIKLTDEEKSLTDKFSCKFYGDFILDSNPATFKDAVKTYVELPKLLGQKGENSVPLKVWLMPLKYFHTKAAELMKGISVGLVRKVQDSLEDLRQIQMRCNDALVDPTVESFPLIRQDVMRFQQMCKEYESKIQKIMSEKLPLIRDGKEDESAVEKLLADRDTTPFSSANLETWMQNKEKEINIIWSCVKIMDGVKIMQTQSELDREVLSSRVEDIVCFVFTSLEENDPTLHVMNSYLDTGKSQNISHQPWYTSNNLVDRMHRDAKWIHGLNKVLANNRFLALIAVVQNNKYVGSSIYRYKNARPISDNFQQPCLPKVQDINDKSDLIWYATDLNLDPETANPNLRLSQENKMVTYKSGQDVPDNPKRFNELPQVLCKEGLMDNHYWEVELSNGSSDSVYVIAGYQRVERKGKGKNTELGCNEISWSFGKRTDLNKLRAYHNNEMGEFDLPANCNNIGVFLNWKGQTLSFYQVSGNKLTHLYTFEFDFKEPIYPGLWARYSNSSAYLCPIE